MTISVIAGLSIGILLIVIFALVFFNSPNDSTFSKLSSDDAIRIVENDLQRGNGEEGSKYGINYRVTDIAINLPKITNETPSYIPFEIFKEQNMKLPLVQINANRTVIRILENGGTEYAGQCNTGLSTYCGYLPPFDLDYEGRVVYGVQVLALAKDDVKEPLFYLVDAANGQIVDSTFVRMQHGVKLPT